MQVGAERLVADDPGPERGDGGDLVVEDRFRQPVLGDAVAHHPAGQGHRVEDRHVVSGRRRVEGRAQPGRAGADDADPLARRPGHGRRPRVLAGQVPVRREPLHVVDRHRRVDEGAPALGLTAVRAHPATGGRERVAVLDHPHRGLEVAVGDQGEVALDVDVGGAGLLTGRLAVGVVVAQQLLHPDLAVGVDGLRPGPDHHLVRHRGDAGLHLAALIAHLDHAQAAVAVGAFEAHVVAQGGDVQTLLLEGGQDGQSGLGPDLASVHRERDPDTFGQLLHCSLPVETLPGHCEPGVRCKHILPWTAAGRGRYRNEPESGHF